MSNIKPVLHSCITPFIKRINGVDLVLWDYVQRAYLYKSFLCMTDDYLEYTAVRFEKL